jgi:16S rRNA (cytosine967-C5)-methyltransferase
MTLARDIVTAHIAEQARAFPDLAFDTLDTAPLDARDAALTRAIDRAVTRRWLTLRVIIESRIDRAWHEIEPRMQAALLVGSAQLMLMDHLPDHAVINDAVDWVKQKIRPKAAGFANAVLRRIGELRAGILESAQPPWNADVLPLSDGRARRLSQPIFHDDSVKRLAQQTSHAPGLIEYFTRTIGQDATQRLAAHNLVQPPIICAGVAPGMIPPDLFEPHTEPGAAMYTGDIASLHNVLEKHPMLRVQDAGTARSAELSRRLEHPPRCIIDYCAGQGTKTKQLAALHAHAEILAMDVSPVRQATLQRDFADLDRITVLDPAQRLEAAGRADLLVLDVPCSNTGVLARRPEAKYRFSKKSQQQLIDLQRQIVADALPLLAPDGHVLYITCSICPEENAEQARWIAQWHRGTIVDERRHLPAGQPGDEPAGYLDGGYAALIAINPDS